MANKTDKPKPSTKKFKNEDPINSNRGSRDKVFKTVLRDFSKMIKVRVDEKTQILIEADADPELAKQKYILRHSLLRHPKIR